MAGAVDEVLRLRVPRGARGSEVRVVAEVLPGVGAAVDEEEPFGLEAEVAVDVPLVQVWRGRDRVVFSCHVGLVLKKLECQSESKCVLW